FAFYHGLENDIGCTVQHSLESQNSRTYESSSGQLQDGQRSAKRCRVGDCSVMCGSQVHELSEVQNQGPFAGHDKIHIEGKRGAKERPTWFRVLKIRAGGLDEHICLGAPEEVLIGLARPVTSGCRHG